MAKRGQSKYMAHMRAKATPKPKHAPFYVSDTMRQHDAMIERAATNVQKGKRGGDCNRTACQRPHAWWYNKTMQAFYCADCAGMINEACLTRDHVTTFENMIYVHPPVAMLEEFEEACQVTVTTHDGTESVYNFSNTKEAAEEALYEFWCYAGLRTDGSPPFHYSELPEKMTRLKQRIEELSSK